MAYPRFLVAKYAPDLARMEPKNIGVFLWWKGAVEMRFLDRDSVPFVNEPETYDRWLTYWEKRIASDAIRPYRGRPVDKSEPKCLDALLSTQKGQYILVDGGELLEPIRKREVKAALEHLFVELVGDASTKSTSKTKAEPDFRTACDTLFNANGLADREDFHTRYKLQCGVFGSQRQFQYSYGLGNGVPESLFQRVQLSHDSSVESAALKLHEAIDSALVNRSRCGVLVKGSDVQHEAAEEGLDWLSSICAVVDIEDDGAAGHVLDLATANLSSRN